MTVPITLPETRRRRRNARFPETKPNQGVSRTPCGTHWWDLHGLPAEDLTGEDLTGEDLTGEDLTGDLRGEDLRGEDLT